MALKWETVYLVIVMTYFLVERVAFHLIGAKPRALLGVIGL